MWASQSVHTECADENIKVQFIVFIPQPPQGQHMLSNIASDKC